MSNEGSFFPRYIDRPRLIGIFEIDEFFIAFFTMIAILSLSLLFPSLGSLSVMLVAVISGVMLAYFYSKFKKNRPDGYTIQKMYRSGFFSPTDNKKALILNPYLRRIGNTVPYGFSNVLYS